MKQYKKDGIIKYANHIVVTIGETTYLNPTHEQILADGWVEYVYVAPEMSEEQKLLQAKNMKIGEINSYDVSEAVNSFTYKGVDMWLSREDRIVLKDRFEREQSAVVETTNLYYGGQAINITPTEGVELINAISAYADACFDNTQKNIAKVNAATSAEEVEAIDITAGYPDKLVLG